MGYDDTPRTGSLGDPITSALRALQDVAGDANAPASARVQAAVALLEHSSPGGRKEGTGDAPGDMDLSGIEAEIARLANPS